MMLTARYRVHAVSVDPEGRYHVAMEPIYEGSHENAVAFAGKPAGLIRIGPLPAEAGKHFTEGVEVLADFEPLEEDIEDAEDPAPAPVSDPPAEKPATPAIQPFTLSGPPLQAYNSGEVPAPATDPAPEPEPAPAEPTAEDPAPASGAPAAEPEAQDAPPASTDQGYPGYGSSY
jgi:hypothetical protein